MVLTLMGSLASLWYLLEWRVSFLDVVKFSMHCRHLTVNIKIEIINNILLNIYYKFFTFITCVLFLNDEHGANFAYYEIIECLL